MQPPLTLRPAMPGDLNAARRLFERYPYKTVQRAVQRLDRERLNNFYAENLKKALEAGQTHWIVEGAEGPLALAGLADDRWHSDIYGMKMGKVGPWLNAIRPGDAGPILLQAIEQRANEVGYEHLSARIDGEEFTSLHLFEATGWRLVDVSLKFSRAMPMPSRDAQDPRGEGWTIDLARPDDSDWIRAIGSTTHGGTHFLNDPALAPELTHELFARWLDRCIGGLAYKIYVARDAAGRGRGFVTYLRAGGFARAVGRSPIILDFVLLDPGVRGGGRGPWLIEESLARELDGGFDYCELRTSAHNLTAVVMYEKIGFRCCASDFVLHKKLVG